MRAIPAKKNSRAAAKNNAPKQRPQAMSKIHGRGITTIPAKIRDLLQIENGAALIYTYVGNGKVEIEKVKPAAPDSPENMVNLFEEMGKELAAKGVTLDDLMAAGKKARKKIFAEQYPELS